jgi:hypothetical protein
VRSFEGVVGLAPVVERAWELQERPLLVLAHQFHQAEGQKRPLAKNLHDGAEIVDDRQTYLIDRTTSMERVQQHSLCLHQRIVNKQHFQVKS